MSENKHYVYMYRHPTTNQPFYVGLGQNRRMFNHITEAKKYRGNSPSDKIKLIKQILDDGMFPIIDAVDSQISVDKAKECEMFLISMLGRIDNGTGILTNKTDGGDGGTNVSVATRKLLAKTLSGIVYVYDVDKNVIKVTVDEFANSPEKYSAITTDTISVIDSFGACYRVSPDDERLLSGLVNPVTKGISGGKTNDYFNEYIAVKDSSGNGFTVKKDDPRLISGDLKHIAAGTVRVKNYDGKLIRISVTDPRFLSGELQASDKNKVTVRTPEGINCKVSRDNIKITSGEYMQIRAKSLLIEKSNCRILIKLDKWVLYQRLGWSEIARYNC